MRLSRRTLIPFALVGVLILGGALASFAQDSGNSSYTVQTGDILDSIAANFDVQTACLAAANDLGKGNKIKPGMILTIDMSCPRYDGLDIVTNPRDGGTNASAAASDLGQGGGGSTASVSGDSYTVERGDTLDTIGQKLNVSVVSLQLANDIGPRDKIMIGQKIIIPSDAPAYGLFPAVTNPFQPSSVNTDLGQGGGGPAPGPNDQVYVVQQRDTLDTIAARFDTQMQCIATNNNIAAPNLIYPGQTILISSDCPRYDGFDIVTNPRS